MEEKVDSTGHKENIEYHDINQCVSEDEVSDQELLKWELNKLKDGMSAYCKLFI